MQAEALCSAGQLAGAADLLSHALHGSAASALVADWVQAAKQRASLEAAVTALNAHAAAVTASLA